MDCRVFPRPMSSHRIPCNLYLFRNESQFTPSCNGESDQLNQSEAVGTPDGDQAECS